MHARKCKTFPYRYIWETVSESVTAVVKMVKSKFYTQLWMRESCLVAKKYIRKCKKGSGFFFSSYITWLLAWQSRNLYWNGMQLNSPTPSAVFQLSLETVFFSLKATKNGEKKKEEIEKLLPLYVHMGIQTLYFYKYIQMWT